MITSEAGERHKTAQRSHASAARLPPIPEPETVPGKQLSQLQLIWLRFRRHRLGLIGLGLLLAMVLLALFAPLIAPENIYDPNSNDIFHAADKSPTMSDGLRYLFGADFVGRSILSLIVWGTRYTLLISFISAITSTLVGMAVGGVSGYYGGWIDMLLMRIVDVFLTLPGLPVLLVAAGVSAGARQRSG